MHRYLVDHLLRDLEKKMVFIGGPRQCGKTTLAKAILAHRKTEGKTLALNWDSPSHRKVILKKDWSDELELILFDELHKFKKWKNLIKGYFDTRPAGQNFIVTGSAKLDVFRKGGDSLFGRYHYWRLHPLCLSELPAKLSPEVAFKRLLNLGGFPEPFLGADEQEARRWRLTRFDRIIRDDLRDLEAIKNISGIETLIEELRARVGSLVVESNLAENIQVSPPTIKSWIGMLERMYFVFIVRPFTRNLARAIQKPFKVFFFDNGDVQGDEGAVFENLVATHLLKRVHYLQDFTGYRYELLYIRDKSKREVDFVIAKDGKVDCLIEAKWSDSHPSPTLQYYAEKLKPRRAIQIVAKMKGSEKRGRLEITSPLEYWRPGKFEF